MAAEGPAETDGQIAEEVSAGAETEVAAATTPVEEEPAAEPISVRIIHDLRDRLHRHWRGSLALAAVIGILAVIVQGFYTVDNGETAALLRFGALASDSVEPGLRVSIPGMHEVVKARTGEIFRLEIGGDFSPELSLVTADENLIETTLVVQYRIQDLSDFLFKTEDPELFVPQVVRAALLESLAVTPVDEVLTSAKASIQNSVRRVAQERLDRYRAGVTLVAVSLQSVNPPREASGAFRAVSDARAEAAQEINRAQGEKDRALRLARGEAEKLVTEARSDADRRLQAARGAAERFRALLDQKRLAPGQTHTELYNTTLQKVLPAARLIVLAPGEVPRIDLHLLEREGDRVVAPPGLSFDDR